MTTLSVFDASVTEAKLKEIEHTSTTYTDLWVDMDDAEARKFVKARSSEITDIVKRIDRSRIDIVKEYRVKVEDEASAIITRLSAANLPFSALIDEHKLKRDKILAAKKARQDAIDLAFEIERDHEFALLIDDKVMQDKADAVKAQKEYDQAIASEAADNAREDIKRQIEYNANAKAEGEERRRADRNHVGNVRKSAKESLMMYANLSEEDARSVVLAITNDLIKNITIKY